MYEKLFTTVQDDSMLASPFVTFSRQWKVTLHSYTPDHLNPSNAETNFVLSTKNANIFENHRNPVMLVLIE